ncbi:MAG: ribonuclease H-like domain-containing protein [Calditrichia bacterium]
MIPTHLAFDVETIPAYPLEHYSETIQNKLNEKISRIQQNKPDFSYEYFAATHGDFGKIICISLAYLHSSGQIRLKSIFGEDEGSILEQFNSIIKDHPGIFIHYNGLNFDAPFILQRMAHHNMAITNPRFANLRRFCTEPHFDVMMVYYNWDMTRVLPLGILAELHRMPSPKEDLSGGQVLAAYQNGEWNRIVRYCEFDTATTLNLWYKLYIKQQLIPFEEYCFTETVSPEK